MSNSSPTWGDTVTITNRLTRGSNLWLVYWIEDVTPACLEYVDGSASWTVGSTTYTQASHPDEVVVTPTSTRIDPPGANSWQPPVDFSANYRVNCDAGSLNTGGPKWNTTNAINGAADFSTSGPTVSVQRRATTVFLNAPVNPQVGQQITLRADTAGVPDGQSVTFTVDGAPVGTGVVSGGSAALQWAATTAGVKQVQASFGQTTTHGGSQSETRPVTVSAVNEASTTTLTVAGTPTVGQAADLTATVTPAGAGGTVTFREGGTLIGTAPVGADGEATLSWIPSTPGERTIDAGFSGRPGVNASTTGVLVTVQEPAVNSIATTTTVDAVPVTAAGQSITLNARVSSSDAGGSVTFYDGDLVIGTAPVGAGGVASIATWSPGAGGRTVRAVYSGAGVHLASQGSTPVVITPAVVIPGPDPVEPGPGAGSLGSLAGSPGSLGD
ncbi:MAG: Ig-like domain-containing protein [Dietzia sp.]